MNTSQYFGPHLTIDLQNCDNHLLADKKLIYSVLRDMPENIGMTRISKPTVMHYSGRVPEDCGVTGVVVLAESHCSIHTFQEKGYCFVDIFSCKEFDIIGAVEYIVKVFNSQKFEYKIVQRGKGFPR